MHKSTFSIAVKLSATYEQCALNESSMATPIFFRKRNWVLKVENK